MIAQTWPAARNACTRQFGDDINASIAGGTSTCNLYSDDECTTQIFTDSAAVGGNGDYTSDGHTPAGRRPKSDWWRSRARRIWSAASSGWQ